MAPDAGMCISPQPCTHTCLTKVDEVEPAFRYLKTRFACPNLVIVVLPGKTPIYAEVKRVGNTLMGVATQWVNYDSLLKLQKADPQQSDREDKCQAGRHQLHCQAWRPTPGFQGASYFPRCQRHPPQ
ncbi:hypothetical protein MRX96_013254 [Rhipicephalus microplus]